MARSLFTSVLALTTLAFLLSGCGWHLRGTDPLPAHLKALYLNTDGTSAGFDRTLSRAFRSLGVALVANRSKAGYRLDISDLRQQRRTVSTSSRGKAAEYELTTLIRFEARDASGKILLGPETLTTERTYLFDPDNAIGAEQEEQLLRSEMQRDLVQKVIRRYRAIGQSASGA